MAQIGKAFTEAMVELEAQQCISNANAVVRRNSIVGHSEPSR